MLHVPMLALLPASSRSIRLVVFIVANTSVMAFLATWLNEKHGGGSIIPGWILHGGTNLVAYSVAAFGP